MFAFFCVCLIACARVCVFLCLCICVSVQAGLNEYCKKTKVELEESQHMTAQGRWECILHYSSCLRDVRASGVANGEKERG